METSIVVCADCRHVIAVGAGLPATCLAAVPENERVATNVDLHPLAHHKCVEMSVLAPEGLEGDALIAAIESQYAEQIRILCEAATAAT